MPRSTPSPRSSTPRRPGATPAPARPQRIIPPPTIIRNMADPAIVGTEFQGPSWNNWRTVVKASDALPMTAEEIATFKSIAGGREPPSKRVRELWLVVGRRGGKDSVASILATHAAITFNRQDLLRGGERAVVACIAPTRAQAQIVMGMIKFYFESRPLLAAMVIGEITKEAFSLNNGVDIRVTANSSKNIRGWPILLCIFDECAFYGTDEGAAESDIELYTAVEPSLSSLEPAGSRIVGISTPYKKSGLLWTKYTDHFAKNDDDTLVIQAPSRTMNSATLSQAYVDRAMRADPAKASAEYLAEFRDDVAGWLSRDILEAAVDTGITVRPPHPLQTYSAFVDASGGRSDTFTCGIAHSDSGLAVLDCLLAFEPPLNPMSVIAQIAGVLREYRVTEVTGDNYAAEFNVSMFGANGISYRKSERVRSAIYQDCLPLFNSGRIRLLDNRKLVSELGQLERKTSPAGKDSINHPPGGHDDLANAAAGALVSVSVGDRRPRLYFA